MITYETRNSEKTYRQISIKCKKCGYVESRLLTVKMELKRRSDQISWGTQWKHYYVDEEQVNDANKSGRDCPCGAIPVYFKNVKGTLNEDHKCNDKCMRATGHTCDCSCGGLNHGANHA